MRRSGWLYSQDRETPAWRATASKVIGRPALSIRRRADTARLWVAAALRRAAAMTKWELSARVIGDTFLVAVFELADHAFEVGEYVLVHLDHPGLSLSVGGIDQSQCAAALFV